MKFTTKDKEERLSEAQELYQRASLSAAVQREKFNRYERQYEGSPEIDGYKKDSQGNPIEAAEDAEVVYNITFELIEGSIDTSLPQPMVTPEFKCVHHDRNARRVEALIKMLMDKQPWETYLDMEERISKIFSVSGTNLEWDVDTGTHSTVGEVELKTLMPQNIYPQPGMDNIDDCDYIFVDYLTTRAELMRKYGISEEAAEDADYDPTYKRSDNDITSDDEDVVTLTVMWYKGEDGSICRYAYSGDLVLEDDDDYYSRKVEYCSCCDRRREICEKDPCSDPDYYMNKLDYDELTEDIVCSDGRVIPAKTPVYKDGKIVFEKVQMPVTLPDGSQAMELVGGVELPSFMEVEVPKMKPTRLPYYKPKKYPIDLRYNIKRFNSFWGISDCDTIRPQQQECNKISSRINRALMKSGAAIMVPEGATFTVSNGIFDDVIEVGLNADKSQFGTFSYSIDISQWRAERAEQKEQAKRLLGISDSFLGQADTTAKSGYAKNIQVQQAAGRLASKKQMKAASFANRFRIIFELYLAFADEPRQVHHEDDECALAAEERFNRYDFYEFDPKTGAWYIDDNYSFSIDLNGAIEQQYPELWQLVKADFGAGMYGPLAQIDTQITMWKHLERLKYPFAKNVLEKLEQLREQMIAEAQRQRAVVPTADGNTPEAAMAQANAIEGSVSV